MEDYRKKLIDILAGISSEKSFDDEKKKTDKLMSPRLKRMPRINSPAPEGRAPIRPKAADYPYKRPPSDTSMMEAKKRLESNRSPMGLRRDGQGGPGQAAGPAPYGKYWRGPEVSAPAEGEVDDWSPEEFVTETIPKLWGRAKKVNESAAKGMGIKPGITSAALAFAPMVGTNIALSRLAMDKAREWKSRIMKNILYGKAMERTARDKSYDQNARGKDVANRVAKATSRVPGGPSSGGEPFIGPVATPKRFFRMANGDIREATTGRLIGPEEWATDWDGQSTEVTTWDKND